MKGNPLARNVPTAGRADDKHTINAGDMLPASVKAKMGKAWRVREKSITEHDKASLSHWFDAAREAREMFGDQNNIGACYASAVYQLAEDHSWNTIRQYVGAVLIAMDTINVETGKVFRASDFKSMRLLRQTVAGLGQRAKKEPEAKPVKRKVTARERQAFDAMFATAEFKALPAEVRRNIKRMAEGESFFVGEIKNVK